jgi:GNAT superfamily N-acetyltransferase
VSDTSSGELLYREGRAADLRPAFELAHRALAHTAHRMGVSNGEEEESNGAVEELWRRDRSLHEFVAAQDGSSFWVCEGSEGMVGFARVARFEGMEELTHVMVDPPLHGQGIGRGLLARSWPDTPTPELGRVVVAAGSPADLSLYTEFGVMPVTGHWHLLHQAEEYVECRMREVDAAEPSVHVLEPERAVREWQRLEPPAIGYGRPRVHEFFGRDRTCLASFDVESGEAVGLCWIHPGGDIGPGVGRAAEDLVPVVLAALDRVAKAREPEELHAFCTTDSWWLLRRLRGLGFKLTWPSWVLCSVPLPGLDRYLPTRPPVLL